MANRVDPLYLRITEPRITDGGAGALPSVRDIYKDLSLTSQFKVSLHLQRSGADDLDGHLTGCGIFDDFASTSYTYDFFAAEANIPGANFDLAEQSAAYQGMLEYMPYRRIFAPFDVTYYVDDNYNILRLFEEWMNYINPLYGDRGRYSGGWTGQTDFNESNAYYRMRYPSKYKRPITITKFEREFWKNPNEPRDGETNMPLISYQLIDAFPQQVTAVPLSYSGSEITKVSVTFGYTRYVTIKDNGDKSSSHARRNNADRYPEEAMNLTPHYGTYYGFNNISLSGSGVNPTVGKEIGFLEGANLWENSGYSTWDTYGSLVNKNPNERSDFPNTASGAKDYRESRDAWNNRWDRSSVSTSDLKFNTGESIFGDRFTLENVDLNTNYFK